MELKELGIPGRVQPGSAAAVGSTSTVFNPACRPCHATAAEPLAIGTILDYADLFDAFVI